MKVKEQSERSMLQVMTYELWDTESRNVIGEFDSEADALVAVMEAVHLNGEQSAAVFTLICAFDDGVVKGIAGGTELINLARQHEAAMAQPTIPRPRSGRR